MKRNLLLILTLGFFIILQGCSINFGNAVKSQPKAFSQTVQYVKDAPLVVKARNGKVEVTADSSISNISIEARIVCGGKTQLEADERIAFASVIAIRKTDQSLLIQPDFPGGPQNGDSASFIIKVPGSNGVEIYTSNASVTASNLSGSITIDTSNGRIELVDHNGPAILDTSNGRIKVENLAGSATVDTSNASVFISLAPGQKGPIDADSSNGSITVHVSSAFLGKVVMDTSNGKINIDDHAGIITSHFLHGSEGSFVIGDDSGQNSRLDTSNASITFVIDDEEG